MVVVYATKNNGRIKVMIKAKEYQVVESNEINDNLFDQQEILEEIIRTAEIAIIKSNKMIKSEGEDLYAQEDYEKAIIRILNLATKVEKFDIVNL